MFTTINLNTTCSTKSLIWITCADINDKAIIFAIFRGFSSKSTAFNYLLLKTPNYKVSGRHP
jgi:hypothetical protein